MTLTPCAELSAASWLLAGDRPWNELVTFGPAGFAAYARLRFLPDPAGETQSENDAEIDDDSPSPSAQLNIVLEVLSRHTRTPDDCYFCLWDGWDLTLRGDRDDDLPRQRPRIAPAFPPSVLDGPKLVLPHRSYLLFRGSWGDLGDWGAAEMWPGQPRLDMPGPAFVWPADHAWCIAADIDPHWAGIGAGEAAITDLLTDSRLDLVRADPGEDQPRYR